MDKKILAAELVKLSKSLVAVNDISVTAAPHNDQVLVTVNSHRSYRYFDLREVEGWDAELDKLYEQVRDALAAAGFDSSPGRVPAAFDMKTQNGYVTMSVWKKNVGTADAKEVQAVLKKSQVGRYV